jgi:hypothetical protein
LVDEVCIHAQQEGVLHGGYLVVFKEPFERFEKIRGELKSGLIDYIRNTKGDASAPESVIYQRMGQICAIRKYHDQTNKVNMYWDRGGIYVDGMEAEICSLIETSIQEKKDRLRNVALPKIVLLNDLYGFGEYNLGNPLIRKRCADILSNQLHSFKAIFVIRDDSNGFIFYPEESQWKRTLFCAELA